MMRATTAFLTAAFVISSLIFSVTVLAQEPVDDEIPNEDVEQIKLTEDQIKAFISAQPAVAERTANVELKSQKEEDKLIRELDKIVAKHGFENFDEFDLIAANISIVMSGIDPETGKFTDPKILINQEREDIVSDDSIPKDEKRQLLKEIDEALSKAKPIKNPGNIGLVKKHIKAIEGAVR